MPPAATPRPRPEPDWAQLRLEFPTLRHWTHLDVARKAPLPLWAEEATRDWFRDVYDNAGERAFSMDEVEGTRAAVARLVGAPAHTVALIKNTSEGMNIVARGIGLRPGENVVIGEHEHENNTFPWRALEREGIAVRLLRADAAGAIPAEAYEAAVDHRTRVVSVAWVDYGSGRRADVPALSAIAHRRGAWLVVDAVQAAGILAMPVAELGADVVVSGGHKALMSLAGAGFMHVREDRIGEITPPYAAKFSFASNDRFRPELERARDAHRFEYGNPNFLGAWVQRRSAERLAAIGLAAIEARVRALTSHAIDRADAAGLPLRTPRHWDERAGILSFALPGAAEEIVARLRERRIICSAKDGRVRISVHFYNSEDDIDRFIEAVAHSSPVAAHA